MRFYMNMNECFEEVKRDVKEMGVRYISDTVQDKKGEFATLELINYDYTIIKPDWDEAAKTAVDNKINPSWLEEEMNDRIHTHLQPKNPNPAHKENLEFWGQFLRDGCLAYSYPERMHPQMDRVMHELTVRPNTRQAIITMYDWHQDLMNAGGRDRVPCSMHTQFLLRDGMLHCNYVMRSCDIVKFFLADAAMAIGLQSYFASTLGVEMGNFTHFMGSLHAFEADMAEVF